MSTATKNEVFVIVMQSIMAVYLDFLSRTGADLETSREVVRGHGRVGDDHVWYDPATVDLRFRSDSRGCGQTPCP